MSVLFLLYYYSFIVILNYVHFCFCLFVLPLLSVQINWTEIQQHSKTTLNT